MVYLKLIIETVLKQKIFVLTFIIFTTLLAMGFKISLLNEYEKNGLLIGKLEVLVGFRVEYTDKFNKYKEQIFIQNPAMYLIQFKDKFVHLKINLQNETVGKARLYLYSVGTNKGTITTQLNEAVEKIINLEKPIIMKEISNGAKIIETVYSKQFGEIVIANKPYYLNYYFVFSVFLLSLIASIGLAIFRENFLND